jgi:sugar phosphate isomerase/epimerase
MQLGFVSAILPDQDLESVFKIAQQIGYDCVEVMCWPPGKAERRYAGVTHIDVTQFSRQEADRILALSEKYGVKISALGYYPNPLTPDVEEAKVYIDHIKKVISASAMLGIYHTNTFVGRDWRKSVADNWSQFLTVWTDIIEYAAAHRVKIGIENCPMIFTNDEWPGGKNLATTPAIWRKMYEAIPSEYFGLNYDPSHMIWQHMDYLKPMRDFAHRLHHIHAKDVRIDEHKLNEVGIMATPNEWHTPKLPGMGQVNWGQFFSTLTDTGYRGAVCVEVEDRSFEGSLDRRMAALQQSYTYLRQFVV